MKATKLKMFLMAALAAGISSCGDHASPSPGTSETKPHTTSDGTEEVMLDARMSLSPSERAQLAQATREANTSVFVSEEAGKLKFSTVRATAARDRAESRVKLTNHSDDPKADVHVTVTREALDLMRARTLHGGTTTP